MILDWDQVLSELSYQGYAVVPGVLSPAFLAQTRAALYQAQEGVLQEVGRERLERARELGVLRLPMKFAAHFFQFLELPQLLQVVDHALGDTAILHLQNGFILPSLPAAPQVFQNQFHQDFPRVLKGYLASINLLFAIDDFSAESGATLVVPATHQREAPPPAAYLQAHATPLLCAAGAMVVFDSTLWHAAGRNTSGRDRLAVDHQFTRSYIKQQIDYVRALGPARLATLPPRSQQLLGAYTQVVTSLDEYYRPEEQRLYRRGQG